MREAEEHSAGLAAKRLLGDRLALVVDKLERFAERFALAAIPVKRHPSR
jgi:hypothetical protein